MAEKKRPSGDFLLDGGTARDDRRDVPNLKVLIKGEEVPPENDGKKIPHPPEKLPRNIITQSFSKCNRFLRKN